MAAGGGARSVRVGARVAEVVGHREVREAAQLRRRTHVQRAQVAALLCHAPAQNSVPM